MTLTNRLSAYFLSWLAFALLGFNVALYIVVRADQYHRVDERLHAALDTLLAACEVEAGGVEWEATDRNHAFERINDDDELAWLVFDDQGAIVDRSRSRNPDWLLENWEAVSRKERARTVEHREASWRVFGRRIEHGDSASSVTEQSSAKRKYRSLTIMIGVSRAGAEQALHFLALLMIFLSIVVWLIAALLGRRLCRKALAPVTEMATAARQLHGSNTEDRLPVRHTQDELEELGVAFNELLDRLHQSFDRQRQFTGEASHQLRTPLTAIRGQIEVALRRERDVNEYRRVLGTVDREVQHLHAIVEMLLFLARADSETLLPDSSPVDLQIWLPDFLERCPDRNQHDRIQLSVATQGQCFIRVHAGLLGQLLGNLLDNALKHSPPQSRVAVSLSRSNGRIELTVTDRGNGIDPIDLPHIFEPFFRSEASRKAGLPGVGLGLAVAKRIAGALGATLSVESEPGQGSCFRLEFSASENEKGAQK